MAFTRSRNTFPPSTCGGCDPQNGTLGRPGAGRHHPHCGQLSFQGHPHLRHDSPVADRDAGASFSIRRQRIKNLTAQDFIDTNMASKDMLDFLSFALNHGASIAICGNTRGGKTSLISYLLSTVHPDRRIYCIEETKEIEVVRYNEDGRVANSVVHTTTRESDSPQANVDMNDLLRHALRFDPDIIAPRRDPWPRSSNGARSRAHRAYHYHLPSCQLLSGRIQPHFEHVRNGRYHAPLPCPNPNDRRGISHRGTPSPMPR